jgi:hypothetical protein
MSTASSELQISLQHPGSSIMGLLKNQVHWVWDEHRIVQLTFSLQRPGSNIGTCTESGILGMG